jgi:stage II sporulation SpoAA-like protein
MQTSLKHDKMRLYYEIGSRLSAAKWEDLRLGIDRLPYWERVAVVTDVGWVRHTVKALRFLIGSEIRVYATAQAGDGLAWIRSR